MPVTKNPALRVAGVAASLSDVLMIPRESQMVVICPGWFVTHASQSLLT
jgi:hypothetical protein